MGNLLGRGHTWCAQCILSSLRLHWHCRGSRGQKWTQGRGFGLLWTNDPVAAANRSTRLFSWSNFDLKVSNCQLIKPGYCFIVHPICDSNIYDWNWPDMHSNILKGTWQGNLKYIELQKYTWLAPRKIHYFPWELLGDKPLSQGSRMQGWLQTNHIFDNATHIT